MCDAIKLIKTKEKRKDSTKIATKIEDLATERQKIEPRKSFEKCGWYIESRENDETRVM